MWNKCGECSPHSEWLWHVAQKDYKRRHDKVSLNIHYELCKKYRARVCERWCKHKVESVIENNTVKILWDLCIQVDRQMKYWRPDIVVMEKTTSKCLIINIASPVDNNLILKRNEKLNNYSELKLKIARIWDKETLIVAVIIGTLEPIPNDLVCYLEKLGNIIQCRNFTEVWFTRNCQHSKKATIH